MKLQAEEWAKGASLQNNLAVLRPRGGYWLGFLSALWKCYGLWSDQPPLSRCCTLSILKKKTLKHPILTLTGLYFPPLSSSILEEEIILLAEQLVSIAAFS